MRSSILTIKCFAAIMMAITVYILYGRLYKIIDFGKYYESVNMLFDLFALSVQVILFNSDKIKKRHSKYLKIIWPVLLIIGLLGVGYFINGYLIYKSIEAYYKPNVLFLFYPLLYALLLIVYSILIKVVLRMKI